MDNGHEGKNQEEIRKITWKLQFTMKEMMMLIDNFKDIKSIEGVYKAMQRNILELLEATNKIFINPKD